MYGPPTDVPKLSLSFCMIEFRFSEGDVTENNILVRPELEYKVGKLDSLLGRIKWFEVWGSRHGVWWCKDQCLPLWCLIFHFKSMVHNFGRVPGELLKK